MGTADRGDWLDDEGSTLFRITGARWPVWAALILVLTYVAVGP